MAVSIPKSLEPLRQDKEPRLRKSQVGVVFTEKEYDYITSVAEDLGITRSKVVYELIKEQLHEHMNKS